MLRKVTKSFAETVADPDIDNYKVSGSLGIAMGVAAFLANSTCGGMLASMLAGMSIASMGWSANQYMHGTRNSSRFFQSNPPVIEPQPAPEVEYKNTTVNAP